MPNDETLCPRCTETLRSSITTSDGKYKSCPNCSGVQGRHAFYRSPDDFGMRNNAGREMIQTWCQTCRTSADANPAPAFLCGD